MSRLQLTGRRSGLFRSVRLVVALFVALLVVPALGLGSASADNSDAEVAADQAPHKVVVCKYVSTPEVREHLSHIVIVDDSALPWFDGAFPDEFADAHFHSVAIRYAEEGEQAHDVALTECPAVEEPPVDEPPVDEPPVTPTKVVVCKYVATPGVSEHLSHIIIVSEASLGDAFDGTFPFEFTDAHFHSVAIRYAEEGEQAHDVPLAACPTDEEPPTPVEPPDPGTPIDPVDPVQPPAPHHPVYPELPKLPNTGVSDHLGELAGLGGALVGLGLVLAGLGRRREDAGF